MKKYQRIIRNLDAIISSQDGIEELKCQLLEIKKYIKFGMNKSINGFKESNLYYFYSAYENRISRWLSLPIDEVRKKIQMQQFEDSEHMLIIMNILLEQKEKNDTYEEGVKDG